jgi:uncharacterized protein (DUF1800 family)
MKKLLCLMSVSLLLGSAASTPLDQDAQIIHVLNRLSFGPRPGDIEKVKAEGIQKYIEEQLNPESISLGDSPYNSPQPSRPVPQLLQELITARQIDKQNTTPKSTDSNPDFKKKLNVNVGELYKSEAERFTTAKLDRAINSPRQLEEVMTEFWYNHFNISMNKGIDRVLVGAYEDQAIRPFALGRFSDMVRATCYHPAMLFYLDNSQNTSQSKPNAKGKATGLNENYARELMELHTLGVDGGYSQNDVIQLAHILTGLGLNLGAQRRGGFNQFNSPVQTVGPFGAVFNSNKHDFGPKVLRGHRIDGTGEGEIEQAIDILCKSPATVHHISYQLAQYFVADKPSPELVNKLATRFSQTNGNIRAVLADLFASPEFWSTENDRNKYKSPFRYVVSSFRAAGVEPQDFRALKQFLTAQGEPLYGCLTPDGYKNTKEAWLNPDALLKRLNFATGMGIGRVANNRFDPPEYRRLGATISGGVFSPNTVSVVMKQPQQLQSAMLFGSPEFMMY